MSKGTKLTGITIVPGTGCGKAFFVGRAVQQTSTVSISRQDVGDQIMRFNEIREKAKADYRAFAAEATSGGILDASILNIYEHILDDPAFIGQVVETITTKLYDLETSIRLVSSDFIKRFSTADTSYFRERGSDMVEVCEKLISYIHLDNGRPKTFLEPVVLVVSRMFTPSDILSYDRSKISAVVTASGGKTSHAAIIARSYSIPVVSDIRNVGQHIHPGDYVCVDATKGEVYVRPSTAMAQRYIKKAEGEEYLLELKEKWQRPVYTRDGVHIEVLANVSFPEDADTAIEYGADGFGLVRTEYLLSNRKNFPPDDVQREYYRAIFEKSGNKHCTFRLMDIGGDKTPVFFNMPAEYNPFMGWRAIRIFLERRDLFESQLTAIMQTAGGRPYSIMLPMVTTLKEFRQAKEIIADMAQKLKVSQPPCGVLFEVPLAILEMESFMKEISFASIGTNDLIQYLSAADRNNAKVNYLYDPIEPAFLRIIKTAIKTSNYDGKPLSICGEMAGNPMHTVLLLGLGLRRFSVSPRNIPILKEIISRVSMSEAAEACSHIDAILTSESMRKWLHSLNERMVSEVLSRLPPGIDV